MGEKMYAAVLHGVGDIRYEQIDVPEMGPDSVKVRIRSCGICGGDIPRVFGDASYFFPIVLGHEFAGDIAEVGKAVRGVRIGDRVAGAALLPCFRCPDCERGNYGCCRNYSFIGSWVNGAFSDYVVLPERNVVPISDAVSYDQAVLLEPCTVALHGVRRSRLMPGSSVAVVGCGTVGGFVIQWCRALGAGEILALDADASRLEGARAYGANEALALTDAEALDAACARGYDFVFDAAGQPDSVPLCFSLAGVGGTICYIGYPTRDFQFSHRDFHQINRKELNIVGSQMSYSPPFPGPDWTVSARFIAEGRIRCDASMIDRRMPMRDAAKAFALFQVPGEVKGKVILYNS